MDLKDKIIKLSDFLKLSHLKDKKIVFTNGCFDIIHIGHVQYLKQASELGDILVLGLNTDNSVRRIKDDGRPINNEIDRALTLSSLYFIDYIILFDEETPYELIKQIKPNVLVKGDDYEVEKIVGYDIVIQNGGKVKTLPFVPGKSTSNIIKKILKIYG
jgi:D-beta-D-heptose 7-phosphate kinase/D-beta-D-heptose 1-phosphate adenosyltransferase